MGAADRRLARFASASIAARPRHMRRRQLASQLSRACYGHCHPMLQPLRPAYAFCLLAVTRLAGALLRTPGASSDETYGSLEPLHFLLYGSGQLRWEYGAGAALRSVAYPCLHAAALAPVAAALGQHGAVCVCVRGGGGLGGRGNATAYSGLGEMRGQQCRCSGSVAHHGMQTRRYLPSCLCLAGKVFTLCVLRCMLGLSSAATSAWLYRRGGLTHAPGLAGVHQALLRLPCLPAPPPCPALYTFSQLSRACPDAGLLRDATDPPSRTACWSSCASAPACSWRQQPCCPPALSCTA